DYMEGSVNALPVRSSAMTLTVKESVGGVVRMWLEGEAEMGVPFDEHDREAGRSRGCRVEVEGWVEFEVVSKAFVRFDVAGAGEAWGNKMEYTRREIGIDDYPWVYGVAFELVTGDAPVDRVPPYNMLHYGGGMNYFGE
ncbi:MAG: hypothetical protein P8J87_03950, partial [Verrucomicrobiales bacterium]|nr:hypothetical protein [Verrucomicrobiales bacterium]